MQFLFHLLNGVPRQERRPLLETAWVYSSRQAACVRHCSKFRSLTRRRWKAARAEGQGEGLCPISARRGQEWHSEPKAKGCEEPRVCCVSGIIFIGELLPSRQHEAGYPDEAQKRQNTQPYTNSALGPGGETEEMLTVKVHGDAEANQEAAQRAYDHQRCSGEPEQASGYLLRFHNVGPDEAPSLDPGIEKQKKRRTERKLSNEIIHRNDGSQESKGNKADEVEIPCDYRGTGR
jgi:hypothetical protein